MQMTTKIKTYGSVAEVKGGTILEATKKTFDQYHKRSWSGTPVEFCWNGVIEKYNDKTGDVTTTTSFNKCEYYCMRPFNGNHNSPTDALLFKITNKNGRGSVLANFYNYLFNPESPWRDAFPALAFIGKDKHGIPDSILWYDTGNTDVKIVANLFSAIRLHTCWGLDAVWQKLVDADFTEEAAILLASNFSFAGQTITVSNGPTGLFEENPLKKLKLSKFGCSKTDMPFSTNYNPSGFKPLLVDKKPKSSVGSLKKKTPVQPNNYIWHEDMKAINADSLSKNSPEYLNSTLKVQSGKDVVGLEAYLTGKNKTFSTATRLELMDKLVKNELVTI